MTNVETPDSLHKYDSHTSILKWSQYEIVDFLFFTVYIILSVCMYVCVMYCVYV